MSGQYRRELFNVQMGFFMAAGQMPLRLQRLLANYMGNTLAKCLSYFYSAFNIFQSVHLALLCLYTTYDKLSKGGELDEITDALTTTIIYSYASFSNCYWMVFSGRLEEFLEQINENHRHQSFPAHTIMGVKGMWQRARRYTLVWHSACILGVFLMGIGPIVLRVRVLPLKCWYPFDALHPGFYKYVYASQLHAQMHMGNTFGTSSSLIASVTIIILGQFDILYCSLKHLPEYALLISGQKSLTGTTTQPPTTDLTTDVEYSAMLKEEEANQYIFGVETKADQSVIDSQRKYYREKPAFSSLQRALRHSLIVCIQHHRFLLKCCDELEALFHRVCLVKSLQITLQLCLLVFVFVEGTSSIVGALNLLQYVMLTLSELMMFTYCGELLCRHSARSADAFWRTEWYSYASTVKRDLLIFLINSRRLVRLTAGKFYTMDVERLRSVITQAISFLTLLQKLAKKRDTA